MNRRRFFAAAAGAFGLAALLRRLCAAETWLVRYLWSGAVTPTSARVVACLSRTAESVRCAFVADKADWKLATYTSAVAARPEDGNIVSFVLNGLKPATTYQYAVEVDGKLVIESPAKVTTFPESATDFAVCFASCASTGSDHPVFDVVGNQKPAVFLHMGDFHYLDIGPADRNRRLEGYAAVHASSTQRKLYRQVPIAYVWDDHDFLGSDSDGVAETQAQRDAIKDARVAYQTAIPHYPLALGAGDVPIAQAFSLGRVRFLLTDLRSARVPGKTLLGEPQKKWLKDEVRTSKEKHRLFVWISSVPWTGKADPKADTWAGFPDERTEIADFFKAEGLAGRVCILSGDAHMLAIDDGSHGDFATGGGMAIPVFQAAALDRKGSDKGGPYSHGTKPGRGQFGRTHIKDDGTKLHVEWKGMNADGEIVKGMEYAFVV
jgi:phosphodiesterase/alkaline phosphatase D-like protein